MIYYNEFDKKKAAMLKQLMTDGYIPEGDIDTRSITEVKAHEIRHYTQCHFFAGIGLWTLALKFAWGVAATRPVWTGSCPCQPFSSAGQQKGAGEDRHLWPYWKNLIRECRPAEVFGEQVASAIAFGWLDAVYDDLEAEEYAIAAAVLPACSIGAPHRRDRLFFVAHAANRQFSQQERRPEARNGNGANSKIIVENAESLGRSERRTKPARKPRGSGIASAGVSSSSIMDDTINARSQGYAGDGDRQEGWQEPQRSVTEAGLSGGSMGNAEHNGFDAATLSGSGGADVCKAAKKPLRSKQSARAGHSGYVANAEEANGKSAVGGQESEGWSGFTDISYINCPDGKARAVKSGIPLLAHGYPHRVAILHAIGDGIVPQVAAEFIKAAS